MAPESGISAYRSPPARELRKYGEQVESQTKEESAPVIEGLKQRVFDIELTILPNLESNIQQSPVMELIFSIYDPANIGVIDFHSAHRSYQREQIGGINLNIESSAQNSSQQALYNYGQKYSNIKSEMATSYVRELLAKDAGVELNEGEPLNTTLKDLFATFFPGKVFAGPEPKPDGSLAFPVRLKAGGEHDIDELSSGEKEVLYGYLRLRNTAPRNSVLLLDEPELHLNPLLIRGLPQFYHQHLGKALGNQIWLSTHSDTFLRETVYQPGFSIFHMQGPDTIGPDDSQMRAVTAAEALERAVMDLVGASYRRHAKVMIFEGGGDSEFDVRMTCRLFPEFEKDVNPISGGNKPMVHHLHELLSEAAKKGSLEARFFCINDRDSEEIGAYENASAFRWDVYHIENYLLDAKYILQALRGLNWTTGDTSDEAAVEAALKTCAAGTLNDLVRHTMESDLNKRMVSCIRTSIPRGATEVSVNLHRAAGLSLNRLSELINDEQNLELLKREELKLRSRLARQLKSEGWKRDFRGEDILALFVGRYVGRKGFRYEDFRELIVSRMVNDKFKPEGMKKVVRSILET